MAKEWVAGDKQMTVGPCYRCGFEGNISRPVDTDMPYRCAICWDVPDGTSPLAAICRIGNILLRELRYIKQNTSK